MKIKFVLNQGEATKEYTDKIEFQGIVCNVIHDGGVYNDASTVFYPYHEIRGILKLDE